MKLCKDCVHAKRTWFDWKYRCYNPQWVITNMVNGRVSVSACEWVRRNKCGLDLAGGFEPKDPVQRVAHRLLGKEYDTDGS